jgi:hypothetical protein
MTSSGLKPATFQLVARPHQYLCQRIVTSVPKLGAIHVSPVTVFCVAFWCTEVTVVIILKNGGLAPRIHNLSTGWSLIVNFKITPPYLLIEAFLPYLLVRGWMGPVEGLDAMEKRNLLLLGFEPLFLNHSLH